MTLSLTTQIQQLKQKINTDNGWFRAEMEQASSIRESGVLRHIPKPGQIAPDFYLPDPDGKPTTLHQLAAKGPVILSFYRGDWCVFCDLELRALQRYLTDFQKYNATIIGVSPQKIEVAQMTKREKELSYSLVTDKGNFIARMYSLIKEAPKAMQQAFLSFGLDLGSKSADQSFDIPVPGTFVVNQEGKIIFSFADADFSKRAEPSEILAHLIKNKASGVAVAA